MVAAVRRPGISHEDAITSNRYREAGVDIDAGNALVQAIRPLARATRRAGADADLGGFGAIFDLRAAGYRDPIVVATTDGVGTKLKIAIETGRHDTVGIDLVAMCVNDLVVQGAEPLFFLDYFAAGRLDVTTTQTVIAGIAAGCRQAGCALIGGETAEMPGMYAPKDYDLAGFAVGAVERGKVIDGATVVAGDAVLGLAASGTHSNAYSLIRHVVAGTGLAWSAPAPFAEGTTLAEALLVPTRIYVKSCLDLARAGLVKAMAHITGGGLSENVPRVIPEDVAVELDATAWPLPPVFDWLARVGHIAPAEMARVFNCGIGMVCIVAADKVDAASRLLAGHGEHVSRIGQVVKRRKGAAGCTVLGTDGRWPNS